MERSKIPMFNRFDLISSIMPFYANTHKVFLFLSSISSSTRFKLDEYYDEFIYCMRESWTSIFGDSDVNSLILPLDLFIINMWGINESNFDRFVEFVINLRESKGRYFYSHYMNAQIKIDDWVNVDLKIFEKLYSYRWTHSKLKNIYKENWWM